MSTTARSDEIYHAFRQSSEKFDYFVLGLTGAVCAYISQTFRPEPLGFTSNTGELVALLLLLGSVFAGFRRIESTNVQMLHNHSLLKLSEERAALRPIVARGGYAQSLSTGNVVSPVQRISQLDAMEAVSTEHGDKLIAQCQRWYAWRNRLIASGVVVLIASRVWSAYQ